jgi:3-hydroxymyristoyl/3-hydroxydecanoyl-(acyl carrier protein) dehydratase
MFFLGATNLKFTHPAVPGELLLLRAASDRSFSGIYRFDVEATAGRNLIASGSLTLVRVDGAA